MKTRNKQLFWWLGALVLGTVLGLLHNGAVDAVCKFIGSSSWRSPPWRSPS